MKAQEIRQMDNSELLRALEDAKAELFNLRFQRAAGTLEDVSRIRALRKDVARYKTILRERQLAAEMARREEEEDNAE